MKKQSLLRLLSISAISMSLFFTPFSVYANTLNSCDIIQNPCVTPPSQCVIPQNPCVIPQDPPCVTPPSPGETDTNEDPPKGTIDAAIVLKGNNIKCGSKLDRTLALEYLNEDRTRPDFDDISISVRINGKTAELVEGAQVDLTEHDGETIAIDYKYNDKVAKTLKLKVDCTEEKFEIKFADEVVDGILKITNPMVYTTFDPLKYVNVEELGGSENIEFKIWDIMNAKEVTLSSTPPDPALIPGSYRITYSLKSDPDVTKDLLVQLDLD